MLGIRGENQIVMLPASCEIFTRVIDNMVRTDGSRYLYISRAAHGGDFSAEGFGDLDRKCAHAAGGALDQNLLAGLDAPLVTKALQGSDGSYGHGCRGLERQRIRLQRQLLFKCAHILSKGPAACTEDCVPWLELSYAAANCFDPAGQIYADACVLGFAQAEHEAQERRIASHEVPVEWIYGRRANLDQDLIARGRGLCNLLEPNHIR